MARVVVITGGSRGIGTATARLLAQDGWDICLSYCAATEAAGEVVEACRDAGGSALAVRADVSSENDVVELFRQADGLGRLGALVAHSRCRH